MSASFDNGVQKYVRGYAVVETAFPVDNKGVTYAACKYCRFFRRRFFKESRLSLPGQRRQRAFRRGYGAA